MDNVIKKEYDVAFRHYINGEYNELTDVQRQIFCDGRITVDNKNVTLRVLCEALGIDLPEKYESIADEKQNIAFRSKKAKPGDVCVIIRSAEEFETKQLTTKDQYDIAIEKGVKLIVMGKEDFEKAGLNEEDFPVILMDNNNERILRFFSILRDQQKAKVVMITGSVGKTTTKDLCYTVVKNRRHTFANSKNTNTPHQVAYHLLHKMDDKNEVYIQETGAGYKGSVRFSASMLRPDIFILTNIYAHHMQVYKTIEKVFIDKISADDFMKEDGIIITNFDDERIRNHNFKHTVKSFAINNEDVDYRAINIRQIKEKLYFDVFERSTEKTTKVCVKILGEHNVYNILAAFVFAKILGLPEEQIQEDLYEYRPEGVRQNLSNVGGIYFNLDCYNVAEESIIAMLKAGEKFELEPGAKKYAIIGGENKLGKEVKSRSENFGKELSEIKMDKFLFCGVESRERKDLNKYGDAVSIRKGYKSVSRIPNELSTNINDIIKFLEKNVKRNDLVMFKGIYLLDMPIAVDKVFGTSFSFGLSNYLENMKVIESKGIVANLLNDFGELEITNVPIVDGKLVIPDEIEGYSVFRIKNNSFEAKDSIINLVLGNKLKNIGESAFRECAGLQTLKIPGNVKVIENHAFRGCVNINEIVIEDGMIHIGEKAFEGCEKLEKIYIPASVGMIDYYAFKNCDKVVFCCDKDSFAYKYALENGISVIEKNKSEENKTGLLSRIFKKR